MIEKLRKSPFYVLLLAVFFCLHGSAENFGFVNFYDVLYVGLGILFFLIVLFAVFYLSSKNILYSGFLTFFTVAWYLFFGAIKDAMFIFLPMLSSYSILIPVLVILNAAAGILLLKKTLLLKKLTFFLNVLFIIYCLTDAGTILYKSGQKLTANNDFSFNVNTVHQKPNVYYLLFDEYAGYKNLADSFNFKNDLLYDHLKKDRFEILPGFSNYNMTPFCMSSILNMNYVKPVKDTANLSFNDMQDRSREIKYAAVFNIFTKMGYDINNFSIFDVGNQKSLETNQFILGHSQLLTHKILHNRMLKDLSYHLLSGKYASVFFQNLYNNAYATYNKKIETELLRTVKTEKVKPAFVYAHFLLPHSPVLYDSSGKFVSYHNKEDISDSNRKALYLDYLKYTNSKIISLADEIIQHDPSSVIAVMSDHGYRDWETKSLLQMYNFNNFCFIRNTGATIKIDRTPISGVNFFRYFFNQYFDQSMPYLKDSVGLYLFH